MVQVTRRILTNSAYAVPIGVAPANPDYSAMTPDGRHFVYARHSSSSNLVHEDLSTDTILTLGTNALRPSISHNGRLIAYESVAEAGRQIYLWDLDNAASILVSVNQTGTGAGDRDSRFPLISPDGTFVVFQSFASDLVDAPTRGVGDIYLRDLQTGVTTLLSVSSLPGDGGGNAYSGRPYLSGDGRVVIFGTFADNLVPGDYTDSKDIMIARLRSDDSDGDGLDDDWELAYFGDLSRDGTEDGDEDGVLDRDEFAAGTHPVDGSHYFRVITLTSLATGEISVSWIASPGKTYRVWYTDDVTGGGWMPLGEDIRAVASTAYQFDSTGSASGGRYYRVQVVGTP